MVKYALVMAAALALAAGPAQAGGKLGVATGEERSGAGGNGVQLNGIPASGFAVETLELPDGAVVVHRSQYEAGASRSTASSSARCWPWTRWRCPIAQR
jgi:hypothetical protein